VIIVKYFVNLAADVQRLQQTSALPSAPYNNDGDFYDRIASPTYVPMTRASGSTADRTSQQSSTDSSTGKRYYSVVNMEVGYCNQHVGL